MGTTTIVSLGKDKAVGETYCLAHHVTVAEGKRGLMVASLRYLDTFVKQDGVWLLGERWLHVDWMEERVMS
jgi:SnoaL-like domain